MATLHTINCQLFAAVAEAAGTRRVVLELPDGATVGELLQALAERYPAAQAVLSRSFAAVNEAYAPASQIIAAGDQVAIIPPVSGGEDAVRADVRITTDELVQTEMYRWLSGPDAGAVVLFFGTVREWTRGRQTRYLAYEAYDGMAHAQLRAVADDCLTRFSVSRVALWHRTGELRLTDISVLVGVASAHREPAFAAGKYAIDTLKRTVPIWKKEHFADGTTSWVGPEGPWNPLETVPAPPSHDST
ncbi:MAG: molybdopterin converting factor subunit 1 [Firmicutes bacterium]|nr:molybdopterin converting factor subunit 1 [Bacillota bacterium]